MSEELMPDFIDTVKSNSILQCFSWKGDKLTIPLRLSMSSPLFYHWVVSSDSAPLVAVYLHRT